MRTPTNPALIVIWHCIKAPFGWRLPATFWSFYSPWFFFSLIASLCSNDCDVRKIKSPCKSNSPGGKTELRLSVRRKPNLNRHNKERGCKLSSTSGQWHLFSPSCEQSNEMQRKFVVCASFRWYSHKLHCSIRSVTYRNTHTYRERERYIHRHTDVVIVELNVNRQTKLIYIEGREEEKTNLVCLFIFF